MTEKILENFWKRTTNPSVFSATFTNHTWDDEIKTLYKLGLSLEDTLNFLHFEKPSFELFIIWINKNQKNKNYDYSDFTENVLSEDDLKFWDKNGYIILKNVISKEDCEKTERAIWEFLNMDPQLKQTWYQEHINKKGLMVNFSDHETLNKNRFSPKIKKAYEQIYNTTKIYKTIDKVSFNPPETKEYSFLGSPLHWDTSLKQPIKFGLQGLLYLTDCGFDDGAFCCVPGFHKIINQWLDNLKEGEEPRIKAIEFLKPQPLTGHAGDFIIWDNRLPHAATPNKGKYPRLVQYLTYIADDYKSAEEWL